MPRKFYRKSYKSGSGKDKYSVETQVIRVTTSAEGVNGLYQTAAPVVVPSSTEGMRKVKHFTCTLAVINQATPNLIYWALVYVPEGYQANALRGLGPSFYEPSQFLIASGITDPDAGPARISTPLSRNLNSGDAIWLIIGTPSSNITCTGMVRYAITLQ